MKIKAQRCAGRPTAAKVGWMLYLGENKAESKIVSFISRSLAAQSATHPSVTVSSQQPQSSGPLFHRNRLLSLGAGTALRFVLSQQGAAAALHVPSGETLYSAFTLPARLAWGPVASPWSLLKRHEGPWRGLCAVNTQSGGVQSPQTAEGTKASGCLPGRPSQRLSRGGWPGWVN